MARKSVRGPAVALVYTLALCVGLLMPAQATPPTPLGLDKLVHLAAFAGLGGVWVAARPGWPVWVVVLACALFAVVTELLQAAMPWPRSPEALDAVADVIGAVLGVAVGRTAWRSGRDSNPGS